MAAITRCKTCNEWTQGFHFCVSKNTTTPLEVAPKPPKTPAQSKPQKRSPQAPSVNRTRRNDEIVRMYTNGATCAAIGIAFGIHDSSVRMVLRAAAVEIRGDHKGSPGPKKRTDTEIRTAVEMYESGAQIKDVARHLSWSPSTVRRILRDEGVTIRPPGTVMKSADPETLTRIAAAYRAGKHVRVIGKEVGASPGVVSRWLREAGITARPGPNVMRGNRAQIAAEVARLRAEGVSVRNVALELGIAVSTVERMMREQRSAA